MDPPRQDDAAAGQQSVNSSATPSPTDLRTPLPRSQSATGVEFEGLSESFQSTDTIRRRPEGYGKFDDPLMLHPFFGSWCISNSDSFLCGYRYGYGPFDCE